MLRSVLPVLLVCSAALPALAQPVELKTLLADLEAGMKSERRATVEETATRVGRLAKTLPVPEVLLPRIEEAVFSRYGTAEYGVVGSGQTAFARVAERASTPGPVVESMHRMLSKLKVGLLREWIASEVHELARRFPKASLTSIERLLADPDSDVREHARGALYTAVRGLPPREALAFLDRQLLRTDLKSGMQSELRNLARIALETAGRVPAAQRGEYLRLLNAVVETSKSQALQELARSKRVALQTQLLERSSTSKDRFENHRRADGKLDWSKLFRNPFARAPKGEGFGATRAGAKGEVVTGFLPEVVATEVFKTVKAAAIAEVEGKLQTATGARKAALQTQLKALQASSINYVNTNDILARRQGSKVSVSQGLLHETYARSMKLMESKVIDAGQRGMYQARVLGLVFAHELAHVAGLRAERPADAKAVRTIWSSMLKPQDALQAKVLLEGTIDLFERPTGRSAFSNLLHKIRSWARYGTARGRLDSMRRAAAGEPDPYARFRRADGTMKWAEVAKQRAGREAAGLAKFGLALFLKELAVVARTGDRGRIEEFFDYLLTTDFYKHYGLFVAGARMGEVAYGRYLSRYVKPTMVNGILKTNLALAAGMALPMIVEGNFEGRAFAISFSSLGLSSALVSGGVKTIRWVSTLKEARNAGVLARFGPAAGRLAKVGGWFYTVAELAVVLYLADTIEGEITERLDERAARKTLGEAALKLAEALEDPQADHQAALQENHEAWLGYRDWLYAPVLREEGRLVGSAGKLARSAKLSADRRAELVKRARKHPAIRKRLEARHGSLEAYAANQAQADEAELQGRIDELLSGYEKRREELFKSVYSAERRSEDPFADLDLDEIMASGKGTSVFQRWNRDRSRAQISSAVGEVSSNRLQAYEDELAFLRALQKRHSSGPASRELAGAIARAERLHAADQRLAKGEPLVDQEGMGAALRGALKGE